MRSVMITALALAAFAGTASAQVFTTQADFFAAIPASPRYTENFASVGAGAIPSLSFGPSSGFAYTINTVASGGGAPVSGLFNDPGIISTDNATDAILITFTGAPVFAVGGNFWSTDINVQPVTSLVTVTLSNGVTESFTSTSASDYRGFVSNVAIASLTIDAGNTATGGPAWATLDNLTVSIPTPGSLAVLGLGGLVAARRRRA